MIKRVLDGPIEENTKIEYDKKVKNIVIQSLALNIYVKISSVEISFLFKDLVLFEPYFFLLFVQTSS